MCSKISLTVIISAVIICNLCFSQSQNLQFDSRFSLTFSSSIYLKPAYEGDLSMTQNLARHTSYNTLSLNYRFTTNLIAQIESDSLQSKTSFWKQAGIYRLEFIDAGGGRNCFFMCYGSCGPMCGDSEFFKKGGPVYCIVVTILFPSTFTGITGKLLGQTGSWGKSAIGTGIGGLIAVSSFDIVPNIAFYGLPSNNATLGTVTGYNIK